MATIAPSVTLSPAVTSASVPGGAQNVALTDSPGFGRLLEHQINWQRVQKDVIAVEAASLDADASPVDAMSTDDQNLGLSWLLMLQQQVPQPVQIEPLRVATDLAESEPAGGAAPSPGDLLQLMKSDVSKGNLPAGASQKKDVTQDGVMPDDDTQALPLKVATMSTEGGKKLPQMLSEDDAAVNFSDMYVNKLASAMEGDTQSLLPVVDGKLQSTPLSAGSVDGRRGELAEGTPLPGVVRHEVAESIRDTRWGEVVAQRVSLMLGRKEQQMEMHLNPPDLGPMEVRLTLGSDQASVVFASQHAAVREALAAATPRLTALLADQGIQLVNVQVASDSLQQQAQEHARQQAGLMRQNDGVPSEIALPSGISTGVGVLASVSVPIARSGVSLYI